MTETKIIQGCKNLDAHCQRALVKKYSGLLYTVSRRYCRDDYMAKEALQEGLIRIFKFMDSYDRSKGSFTSWMKKIVSNETLKLIKKKGNMFFLDLDEVELPIYESNALSKLQEEELITLVRQLPNGYREVFNMYVIDGYSHKEISALLNISASTSRSQLTRAKKLLQQKIYMIENLQLCRKNA